MPFVIHVTNLLSELSKISILSSVFHVLFRKKKVYVVGTFKFGDEWKSTGGGMYIYFIYIYAFGSAFIQSDLQCIQSIHI